MNCAGTTARLVLVMLASATQAAEAQDPVAGSCAGRLISYGRGWLVILQPEDWGSVKGSLTPGAEVAAPYEAKMAADGFDGCA